MSDRVSMGTVSEKLLNFINTSQIHDSYYDIALILVKNYEKVRKMTIGEMADLCYVSQATLSRFCRFLGYRNFKHFREDLNFEFSLLDDYTRQFQSLLKADDSKAAGLYKERVFRNISSALEDDNLKEIRSAADLLAESERIAFFSHHFLWDLGHYFQSKMMILGRYTELYMSYENQMECARTLNENCTAVICSLAGSYFIYYADLVRTIMNSGAKIIVLTQNTDSIYTNKADHIIRCGETNQDDTGKFACLAVLDHIVLQYMKHHMK